MASTTAPSSAVAPPRRAGRLSRIGAALVTTPGRLRSLFAAAVLGAAILWPLAGVVVAETNRAIRTLGHDTVPSIVAAQSIREIASEMDAALANYGITRTQAPPASLTSGADPGGRDAAAAGAGNAAWTTFGKDTALIAQELVEAAGDADEGDGRAAVQTMVAKLQEFQERVGHARAAAPGRDVPPLLEASDLLREELLPAAVGLNDINYQRMSAVLARRRDMAVELGVLLLGGIAFIGPLLALQVYLAAKTRRTLNLPMAAATAAALFGFVYLVIAVTAADRLVKSAKSDAFDSVHALSQARAVAYDANADESYYLLAGLHPADSFQAPDPERQAAALETAYETTFHRKAALLANASPQEIAAGVAAYGKGADPAKVFRFKGYVGDELRNITFEGEGPAAAEMASYWAEYIDIDGRIRDLFRKGDLTGAVALCLGKAPHESDWAFDKFDDALIRTLKINQDYFDADIATAEGWMVTRGRIEWLGWIIPVAAIVILGVVWLGLQPRLREYDG
jgi:hypothetical protein